MKAIITIIILTYKSVATFEGLHLYHAPSSNCAYVRKDCIIEEAARVGKYCAYLSKLSSVVPYDGF